jgi:uncharacterized protein related to proFAR isomerase
MEPICLTAVNPATIKILSERPDGSGVIEMPLLSPMHDFDMGLTASGKKGTASITMRDLEDAVTNFSSWPGPVPVHRYPHRDYEETAGPGDGFIEKLFVRAGQLWAQMDLTASLFAEVKARQWRGFSIDGASRIKTATKAFTTFTVYGGVFTNRPASDVHARVAASAAVDADLRTIYVPLSKGASMSQNDESDVTVRLATAEAKVTQKDDELVKLNGKLADANAAVTAAEKRADAAERKLAENAGEVATLRLSSDRKASDLKDAEDRVESLESTNKDLRAKLSAKENEGVAAKVVSLCGAAIKSGVPPAKIKQFGDYEKDPVKFASGFGSMDTLELVLKSLPRDAALSAVNSGRQAAGDEDGAAVTPDSAATLRKLGLNPEFASVTKESEAREIYEKNAARK